MEKLSDVKRDRCIIKERERKAYKRVAGCGEGIQ